MPVRTPGRTRARVLLGRLDSAICHAMPMMGTGQRHRPVMFRRSPSLDRLVVHACTSGRRPAHPPLLEATGLSFQPLLRTGRSGWWGAAAASAGHHRLQLYQARVIERTRSTSSEVFGAPGRGRGDPHPLARASSFRFTIDVMCWASAGDCFNSWKKVMAFGDRLEPSICAE